MDNIKYKFFYLMIFIFPGLVCLAYITQLPYLSLFLTIAFILIGILLDIMVKPGSSIVIDKINGMSENQGNAKINFYSIIPFIFLFVYAIVLFISVYYAQYKEPTIQWFMLLFPLSITGTIALSLCHEYMHTKYKIERIMSRIIASFSFWSVHEYEHLFYHHNMDIICTEKDKSYAKLNQSLYSFLFQAYITNFIHAFKIQSDILKREKKSFYNIFSNVLFQTILFFFVIAFLIFFFIGIKGGIFFVIQAVLSSIFFLTITYGQHYGLTRRKKQDGSIEPFTMMNTWSINRFFSKIITLNACQHSHHHLYQFCRWQNLKMIDNSPVLPVGFFSYIIISFVPWLWYKMMNKRVEEVYKLKDKII